MKLTLYLVLAALAIGINAAPTPDAAPERTYISYCAPAADRVPGSGGAASQANPYNCGYTMEERCFRDTGKRSEDIKVEASKIRGTDRVMKLWLITLLCSELRISRVSLGT